MQPSTSAHSNRQPAINNARFLDPAPVQLRTLVLNYLYHGCFSRTAQAFSTDSAVRHLDPDGDEIMPESKASADSLPEGMLDLVERREQIRRLILAGKVDDATTRLNEYFPTVLTKPTLETPSSSSTGDVHKLNYVAPTSVEPAHLILNLRIHAFVEACRSVPLAAPAIEIPPKEEGSEEEEPHRLPEDGLPFADGAPETGGSLPEPEPSTPFVVTDKQELLAKAQKLYELAKVLERPGDRAMFLKELGNVAGLLAYVTPETSPMARYLKQERREALANQIDSAILCSAGLPVVSHLELYTRYTTTLWSFMHDLHVKVPTNRPLPLGVQLRQTGSPSNPQAPLSKSASGEKENIEPQIVPTFDLRRFLDSKS
jgi:hypothetical protein